MEKKKQKQKKLKSFPFTGFIVTKPDTAFYSPYSGHLLKTLYIPVYWYCLVLSWLKLARKRLPFFFKSSILNIICVWLSLAHFFFRCRLLSRYYRWSQFIRDNLHNNKKRNWLLSQNVKKGGCTSGV